MADKVTLTKSQDIISFPFYVRQFVVTNLTPSVIFLNYRGIIPTADNRDFAVGAFQTVQSPLVNTNQIAYSLILPQGSEQRATLTAYETPLGGPALIYHDLSLVQQCQGYPVSWTLENVWNDAPPIQPNSHLPVVFFLWTNNSQGSNVMVLAHKLGAAQREILYACSRAGVYSYTMPENVAITPQIYYGSGSDTNVEQKTLDAYYAVRPFEYIKDDYAATLYSSPQQIASGVQKSWAFPLLTGYSRLAVYVRKGAAGNGVFTLEVKVPRFIAAALEYERVLPPTQFTATDPTWFVPLYETLIKAGQPTFAAVSVNNTGTGTLTFVPELHRL